MKPPEELFDEMTDQQKGCMLAAGVNSLLVALDDEAIFKSIIDLSMSMMKEEPDTPSDVMPPRVWLENSLSMTEGPLRLLLESLGKFVGLDDEDEKKSPIILN